MKVEGIEVCSFKRIEKIDFVTPRLTVLIGGNNSGKSSLLQGIHFAITVLQSARLSSDGGKSMTTLGFDQFIYKPTGDLVQLNFNAAITSKVGPEFKFTYKDAASDELRTFKLQLRRGKNANIAILFDAKSTFFTRAANRTEPLSVFVPGLAGVPLREELRTASVVANGIAQGDSNVYLRNILYHILQNSAKLTKFHEMIASVFPGLRISTTFNPEMHLYIDISVETDARTSALEMVGTGCLQAIQLVAYVTAYDPDLLLLDEPDAHLHPSNQRLLASTLQRITELGRTKVILATHSRHMFDALARDDEVQVIWLKDGQRQPEGDKRNLSVLLDLGALDSFELFHAGQQRLVVLTEDTKLSKLQVLLQANGLKLSEYLVQPLNGVSNLPAAVPVADFFVSQADNTFVVIHRDGDCMTDEEKTWWIEKESKMLPPRTRIFVTQLTDIEHSFCKPAHLAAVYSMTLDFAENLVEDAIVANASQFTIEFANKRAQLKQTTLRLMKDVPSAVDLMGKRIKFDQVKGKSLLPKILDSLKLAGENPMRLIETGSDALKAAALTQVVIDINHVPVPPSPDAISSAMEFPAK
ncbi:AAA family ATPase [Pseudolysobacter antarcticus]|nr:AAA family ATPase [Pseudolysobacter antarcticus]